MEKDLIGYRFAPTGEELVNHYLKNKILDKPWLVDGAINEINILRQDPMYLPSLSKLETKDPIWYFFSPREYTTSKKTAAKRTTPSGFWKATGKDRIIRDKRGNGVEIGIKKTLVYYERGVPNVARTLWVMHEYHITCLPLNQRTYVICQVMYKGDDRDISSEPSQSLVSEINTAPEVNQEDFNGLSVDDLVNPLKVQEDDGFNSHTFLDVQPQQTPYDDTGYWNELLSFNGGNYDDVFSGQDFMMIENLNRYKPRKASTGVIGECSSDDGDGDGESKAESISDIQSYQGTSSSPDGSVASLNIHFPSSSSTDSFKDLETSVDTQLTYRTIPSKLKAVGELSMVKTERKKGWFITEEAIQRKGNKTPTPKYIYLMNMIIGFILLVSLIGSVLLTVKH